MTIMRHGCKSLKLVARIGLCYMNSPETKSF